MRWLSNWKKPAIVEIDVYCLFLKVLNQDPIIRINLNWAAANYILVNMDLSRGQTELLRPAHYDSKLLKSGKNLPKFKVHGFGWKSFWWILETFLLRFDNWFSHFYFPSICKKASKYSTFGRISQLCQIYLIIIHIYCQKMTW